MINTMDGKPINIGDIVYWDDGGVIVTSKVISFIAGGTAHKYGGCILEDIDDSEQYSYCFSQDGKSYLYADKTILEQSMNHDDE